MGKVIVTCTMWAVLCMSPTGSADLDSTAGTVASDGLQIHYERYGAGPPLLLVHGWGADSHSNWVANGWVGVLKKYRTVIAIDVRGHGRSDKPHALAPYSYAAMSHDVLSVMDALAIERGDYMGYSMGAFMGAHLLGHHPERFTAMILGGIGNETEASAAQGEAIASALRAADAAAIGDSYARQVRLFAESNPHNDLQALAFSAAKMWPEGYPLQVAGSGIAGARLPVLVVNGAEDYPYVDRVGDFIAALPNGRYRKIPGTDHLTVVSDNRFMQIVVDFLHETSATQRSSSG